MKLLISFTILFSLIQICFAENYKESATLAENEYLSFGPFSANDIAEWSFTSELAVKQGFSPDKDLPADPDYVSGSDCQTDDATSGKGKCQLPDKEMYFHLVFLSALPASTKVSFEISTTNPTSDFTLVAVLIVISIAIGGCIWAIRRRRSANKDSGEE